MDLSLSREVYYAIASGCLFLITVFLCWALFEVARLFRRANHLVDEADAKLHEVEASVRALLERITNITSYASLIGEGVKTVLGYIQAKSDIDWEDLPEEEPKRKKRKKK